MRLVELLVAGIGGMRPVALQAPQSIFDIAVQYAFSGYAALSPLLFAALFWRRSTKWGALAVALWTASAVIYTARVPGALAWYGLMPVVIDHALERDPHHLGPAHDRRVARNAAAVGEDDREIQLAWPRTPSLGFRLQPEPCPRNFRLKAEATTITQ